MSEKLTAEELLGKLDKIEKKLAKMERDSKVGLEDQLFFGMVLSLLLFLIALPFTEITALFQNVFLFDSITASNSSNFIRNTFVLLLLASIVLRYFGAVSPHKGARLLSILCFLASFNIFLLNFLPNLTLNFSVEIRLIAVPLSYFSLVVIYGVMGTYVEPKILSFYADRGFVLKRYAQPIISLLFLSLAVSLYFTIGTQLLLIIVFQKSLLQIEIITTFVIYYLIFDVIGYLYFLKKEK